MIVHNDFSRDRLRKIMKHINKQRPDIATSLRRSLRACLLRLHRNQPDGAICRMYQGVKPLDLAFVMNLFSVREYPAAWYYGRVSFRGDCFVIEQIGVGKPVGPIVM
jgi:hypothetical protein